MRAWLRSRNANETHTNSARSDSNRRRPAWAPHRSTKPRTAVVGATTGYDHHDEPAERRKSLPGEQLLGRHPGHAPATGGVAPDRGRPSLRCIRRRTVRAAPIARPVEADVLDLPRPDCGQDVVLAVTEAPRGTRNRERRRRRSAPGRVTPPDRAHARGEGAGSSSSPRPPRSALRSPHPSHARAPG